MIYNKSGYIGSIESWVEFLDHWDKEISDYEGVPARFDHKSKPIDDPEKLKKFGRLPKSFIDFSLAGGLNFLPMPSREQGAEKQFFDLDKIERFKGRNDFEYWINGFNEDIHSISDLEDENYFKYNPHNGSWRSKDYDSLIMIGCENTYSAYLLNPAHMDPNGEWEAWNWVTEPIRFPSFAHLVAQIYCFDLRSMDKSIDFSLYWNKEWEEPMRKIINRTWEWDDSIA